MTMDRIAAAVAEYQRRLREPETEDERLARIASYGSGERAMSRDTFVDIEPYRVLSASASSHVTEVLRDASAEIEVAADQLLSLGWPVWRMRLVTTHDNDLTRTQLVLTKGAEWPRDRIVFECRRETTYGPLVEMTVTMTSRIAGYWIVPLAQLAPSAVTIAEAVASPGDGGSRP